MRKRNGNRGEDEDIKPNLAKFERAARWVLWLLGVLFAAVVVALVWTAAQAHRLDAEMDVVAASLGGA